MCVTSYSYRPQRGSIQPESQGAIGTNNASMATSVRENGAYR